MADVTAGVLFDAVIGALDADTSAWMAAHCEAVLPLFDRAATRIAASRAPVARAAPEPVVVQRQAPQLTVESVGRRHYIKGNTYAHKDAIRDAGCKWDGDKRAWWTGKRDTADAIVGKVNTASGPSPASETIAANARVLAGRAEYKGKSYYVIGRAETYGDVVAVKSASGKLKLAARDGSFVFWADAAITSYYRELRSINDLAVFADRRKAEEAAVKDVPGNFVRPDAPVNYGGQPVPYKYRRFGAPDNAEFGDHCGERCPVGRHICTSERPCHDCR